MPNGATELKPHIEKIREHLWSGKVLGRAAVMVGAGFSRNAERLSRRGPEMLSWNGLAAKIYDELYPGEPTDAKKQTAIAGAGALKLAQEYKVTFGQNALDALVRASLPDEAYRPDRLHRYLLELPWSDVFTTNYDTLLEKASTSVFDRKYDVVLTSKDIASATRPRIVKLHGSFPSYRPYVLTEEDFRTYPARFAPFVNAVQQSMMENIFCLIGFSGDDPNFQYWSGWVRDNLGEVAPRIYLIGILNLSSSKRQLLLDKGVMPVDLSPIFPEHLFHDPTLRYKAALEWLLLSLMEGQSTSVGRWPEADPPAVQPSVYSKGLNVPPPIPRKRIFSELKYFNSSDFDQSLSLSNKFKGLCEHWREVRRAYSGWLVAPYSKRELLWLYTSSWHNDVYKAVQDLPAHEVLLLLRELIWREELALAPMMLGEAEVIASVLEKVNPYPALLELPEAETVKGVSEQVKVEWAQVTESWVELAFAVAKEARDDLDASRFERWMRHLAKLRQLDDVWQAKWYYEWCLYRLVRMEQREVRELIKEWPETPDRPEWTARRASILAELGDLDEAERLAEAAFIAARSNARPVSEDYTLLSLESWILMLLNLLKSRFFMPEEGTDAERNRKYERQLYRRRWGELRTYNCDPWGEKEVLELKLKAPMPKARLQLRQTTRKPAFDPGRVVTSTNVASGPTLEGYLPAFSLPALTEQAGYPLHVPGINTFGTVAQAAMWIWPMAPLWALSVFIRSGKSAELKEWLTRVRVTTLTDEHIETLYEFLLSASYQALDQLPLESERNGYSANLLIGLFEVISRLSFRFTSDQLKKTVELAIKAYKAIDVQKDFRFYESLTNVFERCFLVLPIGDKHTYLLECLSLPIPEADDMQVDGRFGARNWPEPFSSFLDEEASNDKQVKIAGSVVLKLIEIAREGKDEARKRAIWRLDALRGSGLLTREQEQAFGEALWSAPKIDASTGLPTSTGLFPHTLLFLPEAESGQAEEALRAYLLDHPLPLVVEAKDGHEVLADGRLEPQLYIKTWINSVPVPFLSPQDMWRRWIEWSPDDIETFVHKTLTWWDAEKSKLKGREVFRDAVIKQLMRVDEALARVVLSRREPMSDTVRSALQRLRRESEAACCPLLLSLPGWSVVGDPVWSEDVALGTLRHALTGREPERVSRAADAVLLWLAYARDEQLPLPPAKLVDALVDKALMLKQPSLVYVLFTLEKIVSTFPQTLLEDNIADIESALTHLLEETKLPELTEIDAEQTDPDAIAFTDRPSLQVAGAELAAALYKLLVAEGKQIPSVLAEWGVVVKKSVLPEVRKIARTWEQTEG